MREHLLIKVGYGKSAENIARNSSSKPSTSYSRGHTMYTLHNNLGTALKN